jgi:hypothetical protein
MITSASKELISRILITNFNLYRTGNNRHKTVYCFFCCKGTRQDKLNRHCKQMHNEEARALRQNETPPDPMYSNWKEIMADPEGTIPLQNDVKLVGQKKRQAYSSQEM